MTKNAVRGYVFMPAPDPLSALVLSNSHDMTTLNDNSRARGDTIYVNDPNTGLFIPFTQLKARPASSDGAIQAPLATAQAMFRLATSHPDCPIPLQIRYYPKSCY